MQWDEKELDTQFTPNVYIWTSNSEILAKALHFVPLNELEKGHIKKKKTKEQ